MFHCSVVWMVEGKAEDAEVGMMVAHSTSHLSSPPLASLNSPFMSKAAWLEILFHVIAC